MLTAACSGCAASLLHLWQLLKGLQQLVGGAAVAAVASTGPAITAGVAGGIGATPTPALALKVVLAPPRTHHSVQAAMEYAALLDAAKSCAPVVAPIAGTLMSLARGVGYLLQDVGTPARCNSEEQCYAAFVALQCLHACSIVHGDARIHNLLAVNRRGRHELLWINFRPAPARSASYTVEEFALFFSMIASSLRPPSWRSGTVSCRRRSLLPSARTRRG